MNPTHSRRRGSRDIEFSAVTGFLPLVVIIPVWLLALVPLWLVLRTMWAISFYELAAIHVLSAVVLFIRPLQALIIGSLLGAKRPTPDQAAHLETAWRSVLQFNRLPTGRFVLMVVPSDELNAFACGGHVVVVTSYAVDTLPRDELSGVLAHELSHHLGLHTVALTVAQWLSVPVWLLARLGFTLRNVAAAATSSFASHSAALTALGRLVGLVFNIVSWAFLSGLWASNALANVVGRRSEYQADQRAIAMGFGPPLASALRRITAGHTGKPDRFIDRLAVTHPSPRVRMARIDAALRSAAGQQRQLGVK